MSRLGAWLDRRAAEQLTADCALVLQALGRFGPCGAYELCRVVGIRSGRVYLALWHLMGIGNVGDAWGSREGWRGRRVYFVYSGRPVTYAPGRLPRQREDYHR